MQQKRPRKSQLSVTKLGWSEKFKGKGQHQAKTILIPGYEWTYIRSQLTLSFSQIQRVSYDPLEKIWFIYYSEEIQYE